MKLTKLQDHFLVTAHGCTSGATPFFSQAVQQLTYQAAKKAGHSTANNWIRGEQNMPA